MVERSIWTEGEPFVGTLAILARDEDWDEDVDEEEDWDDDDDDWEDDDDDEEEEDDEDWEDEDEDWEEWGDDDDDIAVRRRARRPWD